MKRVVADLDDGERDPVDGDRALVDEVAARAPAGSAISTTSQCSLGVRRTIVPDAVDVALDDVAAEPLVGGDRALEVDPVARAATPPSEVLSRVSCMTSAVQRVVVRSATTVRQQPLTAIESPSAASSSTVPRAR